MFVCEVFLWCGTLYIFKVLAVTEQMFGVALREYVIRDYLNRQMWSDNFFPALLLAHFNENIVFCQCSFDVVRHFVCCERFSSYRTDVSCCTNDLC